MPENKSVVVTGNPVIVGHQQCRAEHRDHVLHSDRDGRAPGQALFRPDHLAGLDGPAVAVQGPDGHANSSGGVMDARSPYL